MCLSSVSPKILNVICFATWHACEECSESSIVPAKNVSESLSSGVYKAGQNDERKRDRCE